VCEEGTKRKVIIEGEEVMIDACLAPLIQTLNDFGLRTIASCCGHGRTEYSYIRIDPRNVGMLPLEDTFTVHLKLRYRGARKHNDDDRDKCECSHKRTISLMVFNYSGTGRTGEFCVECGKEVRKNGDVEREW